MTKTYEGKALEIWVRIIEEAVPANLGGVIYDGKKINKIISSALREATLAEREACAKIADRFGMAEGYNFPEESEATAMKIAALIRKRSVDDD